MMKRYLLTLLFILLLSPVTFSQEISEAKLDLTVERTLQAFNVPGIAVGILHKGEVVLAKGYGIANINTGEKVNSATNFGIASNSKAFTTTAIALLIDEGKLNWDDKVKKYIPEFKMYNDYVTEEFTIRDLVTHRSGLGLGAGDLMIWPEGHDFTPEDIIKNIHYLRPVSGFRTKYDYDNLLYIIAGVVIERASGMSWVDFIQTRFLNPIKMDRTAPNWNTLQDTTNSIVPHVQIDGQLKVIKRYTNTILDAAGGLYSNVDDLMRWLQFQINYGVTQDGERLVSEKQMRVLTQPQTLIPVNTVPPYNSLFHAYGMAFHLQDMAGKLEVSHTGGLEGIVTKITWYPQLELGIIVLTNQQQGAAFNAITNTIKDFYLDVPETDWVQIYADNVAKGRDNADKITNEVWSTVLENTKSNLPEVELMVGSYLDNWLGQVNISGSKDNLRFESARSGQLKGDMFYYKDNTYAVRWDNPYLHADSFVFLKKDGNKITGFTIKAISPLTDFSYDFHDLDFKRVK